MIRTLLIALTLAAGLSRVSAQVPGSIRFENADAGDVLKTYSSLASVELTVDPQVKFVHKPIHLKTNGISQAEAVKLIEKTLLDQAGIVITRLDDKRASVTCKDPPMAAGTNATPGVIRLTPKREDAKKEKGGPNP